MKFKREIKQLFVPAHVLGIRQEGGEIIQEQPSAVATQDPMMELLTGASQALQAQDCAMGMQVLQMLVDMAQGGGQQVAPQAPVSKDGGSLYNNGGSIKSDKIKLKGEDSKVDNYLQKILG